MKQQIQKILDERYSFADDWGDRIPSFKVHDVVKTEVPGIYNVYISYYTYGENIIAKARYNANEQIFEGDLYKKFENMFRAWRNAKCN